MKRLITASKYTPKGGYLYIFKHGIGPGTIPSDVSVVKTKDLPNYYTAVWLDRFLTADELKQYDIPSETEINRYLDRIGYCQKNGDVVPCDDVEACGKVTASTNRHPKVPNGWDIVPEGDFDDGRWGCIAKEMPNNDGYYWIDADEDDRDKLYYTISYAYRTPEGRVGNIIETNKTYYRLGDALKEVDRRIAREFDDVEACDSVMASEICYRDRDNDDRVVALDVGMSDEDVEEMLAAHPSYYRSTLDEFDDVDACDKVLASDEFDEDFDDEDKIYWVQAYYSKPHRGLADDFATNDWDAAIDKLVEFANQGYYVVFENCASGEGYEYTPDEVLEAVDFGDIYTLRRLESLYEG